MKLLKLFNEMDLLPAIRELNSRIAVIEEEMLDLQIRSKNFLKKVFGPFVKTNPLQFRNWKDLGLNAFDYSDPKLKVVMQYKKTYDKLNNERMTLISKKKKLTGNNETF